MEDEIVSFDTNEIPRSQSWVCASASHDIWCHVRVTVAHVAALSLTSQQLMSFVQVWHCERRHGGCRCQRCSLGQS
eukprot:2396689-Rhodomonas_salina.1